VDRNVLRIGLYESLYGETSVPLRAAINEAVELAKAFGSETSAKFVNGVLGRAVEANVAETGSESTPDDRIAPDHGVGHNAPAMSESERPANTEDNAGTEQAPDRPAEERGSLHGHEL
jgi:hypothetical protein